MFKNRTMILLMVMTILICMITGCTSAAEKAAVNKAVEEPEVVVPVVEKAAVNEAVEEPEVEEPEVEEPVVEEPIIEEARYEDGQYFACETEFDETTGWKSAVIIQVVDGLIDTVNWTGMSIDGGVDKKTASLEGGYPMVAYGGAQSEWYVQAAIMEGYLIETQDPKNITYSDSEGHVDTISGVSIHVKDLFSLADEALSAGPQNPGPYRDGGYCAEESAFVYGWKSTVNITVLFGRIVSVNWNALPEEGDMDRKQASIEGLYPMVEDGGALSPWHEQAMETEQYLIQTQDPAAIEFNDDEGHTDVISGVSIHVNDFYSLANEAL